MAARAELHLTCLPGGFVTPARAVAYTVPELEGGRRDKVVGAFTVGSERDYDQDPRYGLVVLSEIASRALSAAVNDPGTAIAVLGSGVRVFLSYVEGVGETQQELFNRLYAPDIDIEDMMQDFFNAIARDGGGMIEVQMRLQKSLEMVALADVRLLGRAAKRQSRAALEHAPSPPLTEREARALAQASNWKLPDTDEVPLPIGRAVG